MGPKVHRGVARGPPPETTAGDPRGGAEGRWVTMSCFARLAFFFVVIPVLEVVLLVRIGQAVGFLPTLAVVLGTGIVGAALARAEGFRILFQARQELMRGRIPGQALLDGISVLVAGDGTERARLEDRCRRLGLEPRIRFLVMFSFLPARA